MWQNKDVFAGLTTQVPSHATISRFFPMSTVGCIHGRQKVDKECVENHESSQIDTKYGHYSPTLIQMPVVSFFRGYRCLCFAPGCCGWLRTRRPAWPKATRRKSWDVSPCQLNLHSIFASSFTSSPEYCCTNLMATSTCHGSDQSRHCKGSVDLATKLSTESGMAKAF